MDKVRIPLFTPPNSSSSNTSTGSDSRSSHTTSASKPRDNVLLGNGNACYRRITQRTAVPATAVRVKVMECVARKRLRKCILTVDDIVQGKTFKNTQFVFKAGDSVTIIHSRLCDEYGVGTAATIKPQRMLGSMAETTTSSNPSLEYKQMNNNNNDNNTDNDNHNHNKKKKRQYGRREKDASNVWLVVTTSDGKSRLWQRNMELVGMFVEVESVGYMEAEVDAVGMATDMARVCHRDGGDKHMCCKVQVTPDSALWIDAELLHMRLCGSGEVRRLDGELKVESTEEEHEHEQEERLDEEDETEATPTIPIGTSGSGAEECEETGWMALSYNEQWDMLYEEGCIT